MEVNISSLNKKLQASWSSWTATSSLANGSMIDEVRTNYGGLEKKAKLRILIALLALDHGKKSQYAPEIKRLLKTASEDTTDQWIAVTAGLIHNRLFSTKGKDSIEATGFSTIENTVKDIIQKLLDADLLLKTTPDLYYQPLELCYMSQTAFDGVERQPVNTDFTYTGKMPDFIGRERKLQSAKQHTALTAMPSTHGSTGASASQDDAVPPIKRTSASAFGIRTASSTVPRNTVPLSIADLKKIEMQNSLLESEAQKQSRKNNRQAAASAGDSSAAVAAAKRLKTGALSSAFPSDLGPAPSRAQPEVRQTNSTFPLTTATNTAASATNQPKAYPTPYPAPITATSTATATATATSTATAIDPSASSISTTGPPLDVLFSESPLLSEGDKEVIRTFFSPSWFEVYPPTTPAVKFKLTEADKITETGAIVRETFYLQLQFSDHSWKRTKKTKEIQGHVV